MERLYEKLKSFGRKYVAPAVLVSAGILSGLGSGCDNSERRPVSEHISERIGNEFVRYISDGYLSIDEQKELVRTINDERVYSLLHKNLRELDVGVPELEKALKKEGLNIVVERTAFPEIYLSSLAVVTPLACLSLFCNIRRMYRERKK